MKRVRRILSLLLALMMILAMVACADDPAQNPSGDKPGSSGSSGPSGSSDSSLSEKQEEVENFVMPERPVADMTGKEYIIIQHQPVDTPFKYSQDSRLGELAAARIVEVQELYGCTISFSQIPEDTFVTQLQSLGFSDEGGDMVFSDICAPLRRTLGTGGSESMMVDILTVDHIINFWDEDKWGNITAKETVMAGGYFYGVTPALWIDYTPLPYYLYTYNKDLLQQFEIPDLQEYWEEEEWDRNTMLQVIRDCYDDTGAATIVGMTATRQHMTRACFLSTGADFLIIDKINADRTAEWTNGFLSPEVQESLQWLNNTLKTHGKHFNTTTGPWFAHEPFLDGLSLMCSTRPKEVFDQIVTTASFEFGLIPWAGLEPNYISGFYEDVCSVAIPTFAQNPEHTAFLMADLFEGLDGMETQDDIIAYYRENYFATDLDVQFLLKQGASLQYTYWPNKGDVVIDNVAATIDVVGSARTLIERYAPQLDPIIEEHILPNKVALEAYRQNGYFR